MGATTMLQSISIGAGGGSIAWIDRALGDRLEVGPRSAGSYPGPVCYNLGGAQPTTDADLAGLKEEIEVRIRSESIFASAVELVEPGTPTGGMKTRLVAR